MPNFEHMTAEEIDAAHRAATRVTIVAVRRCRFCRIAEIDAFQPWMSHPETCDGVQVHDFREEGTNVR